MLKGGRVSCCHYSVYRRLRAAAPLPQEPGPTFQSSLVPLRESPLRQVSLHRSCSGEVLC